MGNLTIPAIALVLGLAIGGYFGLDHEKGLFDAYKLKQDQAYQDLQNAKDAQGRALNLQLQAFRNTIANRDQELANETAKFGSCGVTKLPDSSLHEYTNAAAGKSAK